MKLSTMCVFAVMLTLTTQPALVLGHHSETSWSVTAPLFDVTDTQKKYYGKTYGYVDAELDSYIGTTQWADPDNLDDEDPHLNGTAYVVHTNHWTLDLGLRVKDWDHDGTPPTEGSSGSTIFDGADGLQAIIMENHKDPPHQNTLNEDFLMFYGTGNKRTTYGSSSNHRIKVKASATAKHTEAT